MASWLRGDIQAVIDALRESGPDDPRYGAALDCAQRVVQNSASGLWTTAELFNVCAAIAAAKVAASGREAMPFATALYLFCRAIGCDVDADGPAALLRLPAGLEVGHGDVQ